MKTAIFAGGCFWGVEYYMLKCEGVESVVSGYIGGSVPHPTYEQVKTGNTGHAEAVLVSYDETKTDYETLFKMFMEIHDPCQTDGQGYDLGTQYRSEVYYQSEQEKEIIEKVIDSLRTLGYNIATKVTEATQFYIAEDYHQNYYNDKGTLPDCHARVIRFK